jgi:hypothetical protein
LKGNNLTKKHFEKIAQTIRAMAQHDLFSKQNMEQLSIELCAVFKEINPRFNQIKFLTACGFNAPELLSRKVGSK